MNRFIATILCLTLVIAAAMASPVFRVKKTVVQSDGTTLIVTRTGADHVLYYITNDGMPVFPDKSGDYCYAEFDAKGNICASTILAHEATDRTPIEQRWADRHCSDFFTRMEMRHKTRANYGVGDLNRASVSCMGDVRIPVIMAEFSDLTFQPENDIERFNRHFNATSYTDEGGAGSVRDYFIAQSDGQFRPQFDIVAKVAVSKTRAEYGSNSAGDDINPTGYMAEAIDSATAHGVDFSPYKNKNGDIMVIVIYPGHGEQVSGNENEIWAAYYWSLSHTNNRGLKFKAGLVMDELADYGAGEQFDGIGTLCHEFSHALGLPDFYNTNNAAGIFGMDAWSLMDYGQFNNYSRTPVGYTAYEREFMGWMKIDTLRNEKQLVTLPPLHSDSAVRAYRIPNEADPTGNEYYILENREQSDWFLTLYGEGMLINHVHYDYTAWTNKAINNTRTHQRMTVIPADGRLTPYGGGKASAYKGDLWPGYTNNMELNSTTTPCDTAYIGRYMNIHMTNIHRDGLNNIVFFYQCSGQLNSIKNLKFIPDTDLQLTASFTEVPNAEHYVLTLCQDNDTLRTDTVDVTIFTYTELTSGTRYTLSVKAIADDYLDSPTATVNATATNAIRGDVNLDTKINSADVVAIYSYIIDGQLSGISETDADVNRDNKINTADVTAVYDIIIKGE